MIYRLTRRAKADIQDIYRYTLEQFGEEQAVFYLGGLDFSFDLLTDNPQMGKVFVGEVRRYLYRHHHVYYRADGQQIIILQIRSTRQAGPESAV